MDVIGIIGIINCIISDWRAYARQELEILFCILCFVLVFMTLKYSTEHAIGGRAYPPCSRGYKPYSTHAWTPVCVPLVRVCLNNHPIIKLRAMRLLVATCVIRMNRVGLVDGERLKGEY